MAGRLYEYGFRAMDRVLHTRSYLNVESRLLAIRFQHAAAIESKIARNNLYRLLKTNYEP